MSRLYSRVLLLAIVVTLAGPGVALAAEAPPGPPGSPSMDQLLTDSAYGHTIVVNWFAPIDDGGSTVSGYNVYMGTSPGGEAGDPYNWELIGGTSYTVDDLTNGVTYCFTVTAENAYGEGPASDELCGAPTGTPDAPTGLEATGGDGQVTLTWTTPAETGGGLQGHEYYQGTSCDSLSGPQSLTWDGSATSAIVDGLENGTTYCFTIISVSNTGWGSPESNTATATPQGTPSSPSLLIDSVGNGTITVHWTVPLYDGGSAVTGYNLYGGASGAETLVDTIDVAEVGGDGFFHDTVSGLPTDGTEYCLYVAAVNAVDEGAASNEECAVPLLVPAAPTGTAAAATIVRRDMSVVVTWTDDPTAVGINDHHVYVYAFKKGNRHNPAGTYTLVTTYQTGPAATYTVSGLSPSKSYAFTVCSNNAKGWGPASSYSNLIP